MNNNNYIQQPSSAMAATESEAMTSNVFKATFSTTATNGEEMKITIEHNDVADSNFISPLWGIVAAANTYAAIPSLILGATSKAEILKNLGTEIFGGEDHFIIAFNTAAIRLATHRSFADWCESNEVNRFAVAQNIVYDGYDMYTRVQDSGVEAVYGELITYYGEPIFELN